MLYRLEHTVPFVTVHNKMQIRLDITTLSYKRLPKEQLAQADAVTIDDLEITQDEKFEAIRGRRISTRLIGRNGFGLSSLFSENPRKYRIETHKDGNLLARSYLLASQSEEPYQAEPYVFDISATVGLGDLKNIKYLDASGTAYQTLQSATEVLLNCLDLIGLDLPVWIACESYAEGMDEGVCTLSQAIIDPTRFYPNDEPMSAYDVLKDLCTMFGAFICQSSGTWKFVQVESLTRGMVKVFPFTSERQAQGQMTLSVDKVIASGAKVEDKPFIHYDQRIGNYDSVKLAQMEVDYGVLKNRLYNPRFQMLDPTINGGKAARGWLPYEITYRYLTPDPQTVFKDNYIEFDGKAFRLNGEDVGLQSVWLTVGANVPGKQTPYSPDPAFYVSAPMYARYDQKIKISGEFFNIGSRGAKVQVIAVPILNHDIIPTLNTKPETPLKYKDEDHPRPLFLSQEGVWADQFIAKGGANGACFIFENLKEVRETSKVLNELNQPFPNTNKLVQTSKGEWSKFEMESDPLPLTRDIQGKPYKATYYTIRVVLFRAAEYLENKPTNPPAARIQFRNLKLGKFDALQYQDIRKERHELEQDKPYGVKRSVVTIPLGSVGGENYYSQILDLQGNPRINWYKRGGDGSKMPLPALTLTDILKVSGRPTKRVTGSVLHTSFDLMDSVRPGGFKGRFMVAGATQNFPSEESRVVLAELFEYQPSHFRRYYTIDASDNAVLQVNAYSEGNIPDSEASLRITFLEPNGRSNPPRKLRVTGGVFPGGGIDLWSHDAYIAWFDQEEDGPYTVTVSSLTMGEGVDYLKTYPGIEGNYAKIEFPEEIEFNVTVTNASGAKAVRKIRATGDQKIQFAAPSSSCSGDTPVLIGVLNNNYPDKLDPLTGSRKRWAAYSCSIVDLMTGEIVPGADGITLQYAPEQSWFEGRLPEDWSTRVYGVRIEGAALATTVKYDQCGYIMEIKRCKPKNPNFFGGRYSDRFYKETN
ncbi:hypothetical protein BWI93_04510 [Siphonobacter sp. BAB-5385]|uniref:hypothetical protein n=1 Tax=Siphonobacter sp. BAB-5385 TaxID=1864822 RepID=UPI000B9E4822|nr:hypothetical protein [Siphonobacter sp. BAB-5385]OZI09326.1 hypothetical protein BWI93_04510 [Siphonobacter sp. BAB-5385]